jgi:hypothetical protein
MSTNESRVIIGQIQTNGRYLGKNYKREDFYIYGNFLYKITPDGTITSIVIS